MKCFSHFYILIKYNAFMLYGFFDDVMREENFLCNSDRRGINYFQCWDGYYKQW